jgi:hypothetical protein
MHAILYVRFTPQGSPFASQSIPSPHQANLLRQFLDNNIIPPISERALHLATLLPLNHLLRDIRLPWLSPLASHRFSSFVGEEGGRYVFDSGYGGAGGY